MPTLSLGSLAAALPGRHTVARYRWELWLLFGIPAITGLTYHLAFASVLEFQGCTGLLCLSGPSVASGSVRLLLMAVSWRAVRRQGRELLTLLWMLEIAIAALALTMNGIHLALGRDTPITPVLFAIPLEVATTASGSTSTEVSYSSASLVYLILTLWFARRASRISAGHAFLLVALSLADSSFSVYPFVPYLRTSYAIITSAMSLALQVGLNVVMLWMMVRFDVSGIRTRWLMLAAVLGVWFLRSVASRIALFAAVGYYDGFSDIRQPELQLWGMASGTWMGLSVVVPLALAWLVRVPQPKRDWLVD